MDLLFLVTSKKKKKWKKTSKRRIHLLYAAYKHKFELPSKRRFAAVTDPIDGCEPNTHVMKWSKHKKMCLIPKRRNVIASVGQTGLARKLRIHSFRCQSFSINVCANHEICSCCWATCIKTEQMMPLGIQSTRTRETVYSFSFRVRDICSAHHLSLPLLSSPFPVRCSRARTSSRVWVCV